MWPGGHPGRAEHHLGRPLRERRGALLHPDRAELALPGVDAHREPAPDAQLGVLVDLDDVLAGAQPVEHTPLAQHPQVVLRALAAEDRAPPQLVDLRGVAVGAGVGEHPARGVLDADDAAGEQRDRLREREQVTFTVGDVLARAAVVEHVAGQRLQPLPSHVRPHEQQCQPRVRGRGPQRVHGPARLHRDGCRAAAGLRAHGGDRVPTASADHEDQLTGMAVGLVVGVDDGQPREGDVEPGGGDGHLDERLAERAQQPAECGVHGANSLRRTGPALPSNLIRSDNSPAVPADLRSSAC